MTEQRSSNTAPENKNGKITGLASPVYDGTPGSEYQLWEDTVERFAPGAFDDCLKTNPDVISTFNHNNSFPLGRISNNTLKVWTDKRGLNYEVEPPDTTAVKDLLVSIKRGDVAGSSIKFSIDKVEWQRDNNKDVRLIRKAKLVELGPVTTGAYGSATAFVRSDERAVLEQERDNYRSELETEKRLARLHNLQRSK